MFNQKHLRVLLFGSVLMSYVSLVDAVKTADVIIFSYHRPLQLHAVLSSLETYVSNVNRIFILYRTDNQEYEAAYQEVQQIFPAVTFVKQGNNPRADFKPLLLQCFFGTSAEYLIFGVDDDMFKDYVDISECIEAMEMTDAYGFYMRLGANIIRQYGQDLSLKVPPATEIQTNIFKFQFKDGIGDWRYPNSVDMTLYKKAKIEHYIKYCAYTSPNTLEATWAGRADLNLFGLFFKESKQFTLPLNIVQQDWVCNHENSFSAADLLVKWQKGQAMDIRQFYQAHNDCAFMGYVPQFICRQ